MWSPRTLGLECWRGLDCGQGTGVKRCWRQRLGVGDEALSVGLWVWEQNLSLGWDQRNSVGGANDLRVEPWCGCGHGFRTRALIWNADERHVHQYCGCGALSQETDRSCRTRSLECRWVKTTGKEPHAWAGPELWYGAHVDANPVKAGLWVVGVAKSEDHEKKRG